MNEKYEDTDKLKISGFRVLAIDVVNTLLYLILISEIVLHLSDCTLLFKINSVY